jgi:hypothetical protein
MITVETFPKVLKRTYLSNDGAARQLLHSRLKNGCYFVHMSKYVPLPERTNSRTVTSMCNSSVVKCKRAQKGNQLKTLN